MTIRTLLCLLWFHSAACGATWYVDNRTGSDDNGGTTQQTALATIARAVSLSQTSDTIVLTSSGVAYHEPILLARRGGSPQKPFTIEGNGAVLSGLETLPPEKWQKTGDDLYFFPLSRTPYGQPYLASGGNKLVKGTAPDALAPEQFHWDREAGIYFRCASGKTPASYDLGATLLTSGFATSSASYIVCRNLVCEYFANDGFNMHGDCRGIYLENVVARHNGDDGISIHETGGLVVRNAHVHHNTFGLQDVNAARSFYNGVVAEHNHVGASFHGGSYSLVDCCLRDNAACQIELVDASPQHLIGSDYNPICRTTLFAGNLVVSGQDSQTGLRVGSGARAVVEHSVFSGLKTGIVVEKDGLCHLTTSVIAACLGALASDSPDVFRDYNVYHPAQMKWLGVDYGPDQWSAFRERALHDEHSKTGPVNVGANGAVGFPERSPAREMGKPAGPTAPVMEFAEPGKTH
ncbi:MAG: right-handed parallel beta-helix repeat-containing protein [Rhodopirellula sp.]|nr:right-handed parallel beta-helix repeat-containing protein [Rhodopirellula sp.]